MEYKIGDRFIYGGREFQITEVRNGEEKSIYAKSRYNGDFRYFTMEEMEKALKIPETTTLDNQSEVELYINLNEEEMKSLILPYLEVLGSDELKKIYEYIVKNITIDTY